MIDVARSDLKDYGFTYLQMNFVWRVGELVSADLHHGFTGVGCAGVKPSQTEENQQRRDRDCA